MTPATPRGRHGFLLSGGSFITIDDPIQTVAFSAANGINDAGQIVGSYADDTGLHGFLLSGNIFVPIDDPIVGQDVPADHERLEGAPGSVSEADPREAIQPARRPALHGRREP